MTEANFKKAKKALTWVKGQINLHPRRYNQRTYCGSSCCIGGWLDVYTNGHEEHLKHEIDEVATIAKAAIGIGINGHTWLFDPDFEDRRHLKDAMLNASTSRARVEVACKAINLWLKEKKAKIKKKS